MSMLRQIVLLGPQCNGGFLWRLTTSVIFNNKKGRHIDRAAALRGLNISPSIEEIKERETNIKYNFLAPELLIAHIDKSKSNTQIAGPSLNDFQNVTALQLDSDRDPSVLLSPIGDRWPDVDFIKTNTRPGRPRPPRSKRVSQITVPECRLSVGAIPIRIEASKIHRRRATLTSFAKFLGYNFKKKTVFGGIELVDQSEERPKITLVPEGIEIDVKMPNPFRDMHSGSQSEYIAVTVRVEPDGDDFQARLVRLATVNEDQPQEDSLAAQFRDILYALKQKDAPLLAEADTRSPLPPFAWKLKLDSSGLRISQNDDIDWQIKIDPKLITVRLVTNKGSTSNSNVIARLETSEQAVGNPEIETKLELVRYKKGEEYSTTLRYTVADKAGTDQLISKYQCDVDGKFSDFTLESTKPLKAYTPLYEAAERRVQPTIAKRYAFIPVKQGTLQIPAHEPAKNGPERGNRSARRSAFQGNCVFRPKLDSFVLELDNSTNAKVETSWVEGNAKEVLLKFGGVSGSLREALYTAEESPTPECLLPTGRYDPAALRELIPRFSPDLDLETNSISNSTVKFISKSDSSSDGWELKLNCSEGPILWTACRGLPLITAAPMLTQGKSSTPSQLRSLMPVAVERQPALIGNGISGLPDANVTPVKYEKEEKEKNRINLPWPHPDTTTKSDDGNRPAWGSPSVQMVSPTAPGLDYAFHNAMIINAELPSDENVQVSLRYDLPILDELFSLPTGEESNSKQNEGEDSEQIRGNTETFGVLSIEAMKQLWDERKFQLAATRTQGVRATFWTNHNVEVDGHLGLAEPYSADAKISFSSNYELDGDTPHLGGYQLVWAGRVPQLLSGEKALIGPRGDEIIPLPLMLTADKKLVPIKTPREKAILTLTGFAPDAYITKFGLADTRGTSMQNFISLAGEIGGVVRDSEFLDKSYKPHPRKLLTLSKPLKVLGVNDDSEVWFWVRDLPLDNKEIFFGYSNPVEGRIGPDSGPFNSGALQDSLYEWRFFESPTDGSIAPHTVRFGELSLAPLKLLYFEPGHEVKILFRAALAKKERQNKTEKSHAFGPEETYAIRPLIVLEFNYSGENLKLVSATPVALNNEGNNASHSLKTLAGINGQAALVPVNEIEFSIEVDLALRIAGERAQDTNKTPVKWPIGAKLSVEIPQITERPNRLLNASLKFHLFGREIELKLTRMEAESHYVFSESVPGEPGTVWIVDASLSLISEGTNPWALEIGLGASLQIDDREKQEISPFVLHATQNELCWLGLSKLKPKIVVIDITRGALWIVIYKSKPATPATPITGIKFDHIDSFDYSAAIVIDFSESNTEKNNEWCITSSTVQAELVGRNGSNSSEQSHLALRNYTKKENKAITTSEVLLDRDFKNESANKKEFAFQNSGIKWDPDAVPPISQQNSLDAEEIKIKKTNPYGHRVSISLAGHPIPTEALGKSGDSVVLLRSIPLTLQVRHKLKDVNKKTIITWRSLETVMLTSESIWKQNLENHKIKTFGPRYVKSRAAYRDADQPGADAPGVGSREAMLSGFDDHFFLSNRLIAEAEDEVKTTLMFLGGGKGFFEPQEVKDTQKDKNAILFGLPWVVGFDATNNLPDRFRNLMLFSDTERTWKAAQFDAQPFEINSNAIPQKLLAPTSLIAADDIDKFFNSARREREGERWERILARATEQVYFEPSSKDIPPREEWPFFLSALVALKAVLRQSTSGRVISLHPFSEGRVLAVSLPKDHIETYVKTSKPKTEIRLLALARTGDISISPLDFGGATINFEEAAHGLNGVRIAELAATRIADPQLVGIVEVVEYDTKHVRILRAHPIRLTDNFDEFGREADQLFDPQHQVYPSSALGWPETVDSRPADFAMRGTADSPVISAEAGLAARSAALSTGAVASRQPERARYLATQARSVFEHGENQQNVLLPAPPARHLSLLAPRCRTPHQSARELAMAKAMTKDSTDGQNLLEKSMGMILPTYSRSFIGQRPGVLQTHIDTMVTDGDLPKSLDEGAAEFGRSGVMSPVMARQVRTPRSPALPDDPNFDLNTRRRTYVSEVDRYSWGEASKDDRDPAKTMLARSCAAAMWRLRGKKKKEGVEKTEDTDRFILELVDAAIDPFEVIESQKTGKPFSLKLKLLHTDENDFDASKTMKRLEAAGFLRRTSSGEKKASLRAWLSFAKARIDAVRLKWQLPKSAGKKESLIEMELEFSNLDLAAVREELLAPDPNIPAQLHFSFLSSKNGDLSFEPEDGSADITTTHDKLMPGVPILVTLPIGRKPLARVTPDIRRRTFLFCDPAFDRVLSGPGKSSQLLRINNDKDAAMLAVDRTEYDLSRTLYFAFGKIVNENFEPFDHNYVKDASLAIKLKPKTEYGGKSDSIVMSIAGIDATELDVSAQVYAIPLSCLQSEDSKLRPKPGDSLSIEVTLKDKVGQDWVTKMLSVEVPIAKRVDDPRPAAVYSIVGLSQDLSDARTLLHATAPAPDRVEFVDLLADLASGHIRKRAIFEWRETDLTTAPEWPHCTLTKTDRAGGAQLPRKSRDIY